MIRLTTEQAQQIEEIVEHLLVDHPTARHHKACVEALSIIRAARAQEPVTHHNIIGYQPINNSASVIAPPKNPNGKPRPAPVQQVEQEPVAWQFFEDGKWWIGSEYNHHRQLTEEAGYPIRELYAAPVRTNDLTDSEIADIGTNCGTSMWSLMFARAVIAKDRRKNKC